LFKLSLNGYAAKDTICVLFLKKKLKKDPKLSLSELLSRMTRIQINPPLFIWPSMWIRLEHAHCLETINDMSGRESVNRVTRGRKWTLTDSERKRNRNAVSSKWNKCRGSVEPLERTQESATRPNSRWSGKDFAW
jgi:hypothetical protein